MKTIKIEKSALIKIIADNCSDFGTDFLGIYVDVSGMGEFIDENQNYPDDEGYDTYEVAKHIVDNGWLNHDGELLQDDGSEKSYEFEVVS